MAKARAEAERQTLQREREAAAARFAATQPSAYEEDDGDAIVQDEIQQSIGTQQEAAPDAVVARQVNDAPEAEVADIADVAEPVEEENVEFSTNPCKGPSARFLSTCR